MFRKELGEGNNSDKVLVNEIIAGNIKLLPKSEIIKKLKEKASYNGGYYYNVSLYVNEMVSQEDKERVEKEFNERETKINEYREKLHKATPTAGLTTTLTDGNDTTQAKIGITIAADSYKTEGGKSDVTFSLMGKNFSVRLEETDDNKTI